MAFRIFFGDHSASASAQSFDAVAGVVEWVLPPAAASWPQSFDAVAGVVEWVLPAASAVQPQAFDAVAGVVEWVLPPAGAGRGYHAGVSVVEWVSPAARAHRYNPNIYGLTAVYVQRPDLSEVPGLAGPLIPLAYKIDRYENRIGAFSVTIAVDDQDIAGVPLSRTIETGWRVSILQENNSPEFGLDERWLLYQGIVKDRAYVWKDGGVAGLELRGALRTEALARRSTHRGLYWPMGRIGTIAQDLVNGYLGANGDVIATATARLSVAFHDISRYEALLKLADLGRQVLRETWEMDRPELVRIDGPPWSGITLVNVEGAGYELQDAAKTGYGLISGLPSVRYDGTQVVNRIIPLGSDTPDGDLTLGSSDQTTPYAIKSALNPDGSTYYYIEDEDSIDRYGLVELDLVRTDVKNPSDNAGTRLAAANVLYAVAANELVRRRSEAMSVAVPVANGAQVWMLPGDMTRLRYAGQVRTEDGRVTWLDIDKRLVVSERHDEGDASGVRKVEFVVAAPVMEWPIGALPNSIPTTDPGYSSDEPKDISLPDISGPNLNDLLKPTEGCCDDPTTDVTDADIDPVDPGDPITVIKPPSPPVTTPNLAMAAWYFNTGGGAGPNLIGDAPPGINWSTIACSLWGGSGPGWLIDPPWLENAWQYRNLDTVPLAGDFYGGLGAFLSGHGNLDLDFEGGYGYDVVAGDLIIIAVTNSLAGGNAPELVSASYPGITWTIEATVLSDDTRIRLTILSGVVPVGFDGGYPVTVHGLLDFGATQTTNTIVYDFVRLRGVTVASAVTAISASGTVMAVGDATFNFGGSEQRVGACLTLA